MEHLRTLWHHPEPDARKLALEHYWCLVRDDHMELELEMDRLDVDRLRGMDAEEWYDFLLKEYFRSKYTAPNRYATTTAQLKRQAKAAGGLDELFLVKKDLLGLDPADIERALEIPRQIWGLGIAGASGLLAWVYPKHFGTVDQFVVIALRKVPEALDGVRVGNPESIGKKAGAGLIRIMREKAAELNRVFQTDDWTPRKVDMVLWAVGKQCSYVWTPPTGVATWRGGLGLLRGECGAFLGVGRRSLRRRDEGYRMRAHVFQVIDFLL